MRTLEIVSSTFVSTCCAWHLAEDIHDGFNEGDFVLHSAVAALDKLIWGARKVNDWLSPKALYILPNRGLGGLWRLKPLGVFGLRSHCESWPRL